MDRRYEGMRFKVHQAPDATRVVLDGDIADGIEAVLLTLRKQLKGPVIALDCAGIRHVSSRGLPAWAAFLDELPEQATISFESCSPTFIHNANAISAILGRGRIVSFFADFVCSACRAPRQVRFEVDAVRAAGGFGKPACPKCHGTTLRSEADEASYLAFLDET